MQLLTMLDVIIGVFFVYLIFSLVTSAVNEGIAAMLSSRAQWMRKGITSLFDGKPGPGLPSPRGSAGAQDHTAAFYNSPFIRYLTADGRLGSWKVSYVPASSALKALLTHPAERVQPVERHERAGTLDRSSGAVPETAAALNAAVERLPEGSPIRAVLEDLAARAKGDVQAFEQAFAEWYQGFEGQVIAWYRQKTHLMLAVIAVVVTALMNVDTLAMVKQLSANPELAKQVAELAISKVEKGEIAGDKRAALDAARKHRDEVGGRAYASATDKDAANKAYLDALGAYESASKAEIQEIPAGLKFGWEASWFASLRAMHASGDVLGSLLAVLTKVAGILLTAAALTLGAPFWFDMLKKVAQIRAVGKSLAEQASGGGRG